MSTNADANRSVLLLPARNSSTDFRTGQLQARIKRMVPMIERLRVQEFFLVNAEARIGAADLRPLLGDTADAFENAGGTLYVVPRLGTLSPWSSKATDIAQVCGLHGVQRIERGRAYLFEGASALPEQCWNELHDPMTESVLTHADALRGIFAVQPPRALRRVDLLGGGKAALESANRDWGLALSAQEIDYLVAHFVAAKRNPSDAELMMFAQINSEHCRHKIFNGDFEIDDEPQPHTLFEMIKLSYAASPEGVLSAYSDNAAVIAG